MAIRKRRRRQQDTTPAVVDVVAGTLVFHNGTHRTGRLHDVPTHLAIFWQRQRWATVVDQPAGAASNTEDIELQAAAMTADSLGESDELRGTSTEPTPGAKPFPGDKNERREGL